MDDMIMKSAWEVNHLDDLQETFNALRFYNMKLNHSKCIFGMALGKFLGFMVAQHIVKANPDKIQAIMEMTPPKNIKEVQSLNVRVEAFNRFDSRATNKCLPFFKVLRKALSGLTSARRLSKN